MRELFAWLYPVGFFLLIAVGTLACGLILAKIFSLLLKSRAKLLVIVVKSIAFAVGSLLGSFLIFILLDRHNSGYSGVAGGIIFLTAIFQGLTNFGFVLWSSHKSSNSPSWKWKIVALLACSPIGMFAIAFLK